MNFEETAYESCHPVEKRCTYGSPAFRKDLCGSCMRLSNANGKPVDLLCPSDRERLLFQRIPVRERKRGSA